jgi:hypothetical protein
MDGYLSKKVREILECTYQVHFNNRLEVIKKEHDGYNLYITDIYLHNKIVPLSIIKECENDEQFLFEIEKELR